MSRKDKLIKNLQKENDSLTQNVLDKIEVIKELENDYMHLQNDYLRKVTEVRRAPEIPVPTKKTRVKYDRHFTLAFELNPFKWFTKPSYYRYKWQNSPQPTEAREGQVDFGPVSFSWYRDRV